MNNLQFFVLFIYSLHSLDVIAEQTPCPTFENRSVTCFPRNREQQPTISRIEPEVLERFKIVDSAPTIFSQHPDSNVASCRFLGEIEHRQNLVEQKMSDSLLLDINKAVDLLDGNRVVLRKQNETGASRVYECP